MGIVFAANLSTRVNDRLGSFSEERSNQGVALRYRFLQMRDVAGDGKDRPMGALLGEHNPVNGACGVRDELRD